MARFNYAYQEEDKTKTARAIGTSLKISPKHAIELSREIRGKDLEHAKTYLEEVIGMSRPVPFKRFNKKVGHRKGLSGWPSGRYPVKAAAQILKILKNAEANAEYKGLDIENLKITHISSHRGRVMKGYTARAFGRGSASNTPTTHVQIVLGEG